MSDQDKQIKRNSFTVSSEEVKQDASIQIAQEPYYLSEAEYVHIKNGDSKSIFLGITIFLTSIGFLLVLLAKLFVIRVQNGSAIIEPLEWHVVWIGAILGVIIFLIGKFIFKSEKYKVMKSIKTHYEKSKIIRQYPRREE